MEIGKFFFWKKHGKLAHLRILAPKIFHDLEAHVESMMEEDVQPSFGLAIDEGQNRDHTLGFQHSSFQRQTNGIYNIISPHLRIGMREAELSRHTRGDG